ncbi:Histone-lysine N-methyltransferase SETMAR, partial [Habropoda laboriosa]
DNARPHIAHATLVLASWKFQVLPRPPYSSDLAPSDFHIFTEVKRTLKGIHLKSDGEVLRPK